MVCKKLFYSEFPDTPKQYCREAEEENYRGLLGQHGLCFNTNARPSFLNTRPSSSNFWPSFHFLFRLQKLSKLCCKFRAFIKCMKVTFYRPGYRKFFMCPLITNLSRVFFFKKCGRTFETLSRPFETLAFEGLREN